MNPLSAIARRKWDWPVILTFAYYPIYIVSWALIQLFLTPRYWIYCRLDDYIPFCEAFVVPYAFWYIFFIGPLLFFLLKSRGDFLRCGLMTAIGVTTAIAIFCILPNGIAFRPTVMPRENIFTWALAFIYRTDPPYSCMPSLHCYIAITMAVCLCKSRLMDGHRVLKAVWWIIAFFICISTVLVKQHSVLDIFGGILLVIPCYLLAYKVEWRYMAPKGHI